MTRQDPDLRVLLVQVGKLVKTLPQSDDGDEALRLLRQAVVHVDRTRAAFRDSIHEGGITTFPSDEARRQRPEPAASDEAQDWRAITLPFGKHRGRKLADVPAGYLAWLLANIDLRSAALRRAVSSAVAEHDRKREKTT